MLLTLKRVQNNTTNVIKSQYCYTVGMNVFCSYAYTGEDVEMVTKRMQLVVETLKKAGHEVYCPLFDERVASLQEAGDVKAIFVHAFEGIRRQDVLVVINSSDRRSEGQLMEIGAALSAGKAVYLMQHTTSVGLSYLPKLVTETHVWSSESELSEQLRNLAV
jgi:nucleoside 2-deoxyribosyltransferase